MFTNISKINLPEILIKILKDLQDLGSKPILVGGCVRDSFLDKKIKDYDIEIFALNDIEIIQKTLEKYAKIKLVGKSFGVLTCKIDELDFDFSLPRVEQKIGKYHQDFSITTNPNLSFKEAAIRRDFTINAIGYDYFKNEFLDPFCGIEDLKNGVLKHINDNTFIEDSLRVYRAVQFASRFELKLDESTKILCKNIINSGELKYLPRERIFEELKKLFIKSKKPSIGLELLRELEIFDFINSFEAIDNLANIIFEEEFDNLRKLSLFFSILCKNMKKDIKIEFLKNLSNDKKFIEIVLNLSSHSLTKSDKELKKLSLLLNLEDMIIIEKAFKNENIIEIENLTQSLDIYNKPLKRLIFGRDLINLGFKEGLEFKEILDYALVLQIENCLNKEEIINLITKNYKIKSF